jgi:aquaporin Z
MLEGVVVSMPARSRFAWREEQPSPSPVLHQGKMGVLLIHAGHRTEAERETQRLAQLLEGPATDFEAQVLLNPDRQTVINAVELLIRTYSEPDDTILIHFNGPFTPGGEGGLFFGSSNRMEMSSLTRLLNRSGAGRQVFILDGLLGSTFDLDAVRRGFGWREALPQVQSREVIWAQLLTHPPGVDAASAHNGLTSLLVDTIEHSLVDAQEEEISVRRLFDLVRDRASRLGVVEVLNPTYFFVGTNSARIAFRPSRAETTTATAPKVSTLPGITRRASAEFFGTFWLTFGGCGSAVLAAGFPNLGIGFLGVAMAFGISVLTMAYAVGHVSGGHFNPAVTIGLWAGGRFKAQDILPYILAQVIGATVAAAVLYMIASGTPGWMPGGFAANGYGNLSPGKYGIISCFIAELLTTFFFLFVIIGSTSRGAAVGFAGIPIGFCLTLIHLVTIPVTGTSVNPARSTGPALFTGGEYIPQLWLFWLAPIVGAAVAGRYTRWLYRHKLVAAATQEVAKERAD